MTPLRVLDLSTGIAGAYAAKLLGDAGADVCLYEPPDGHPLRRWSAGGEVPAGGTGALFRYLRHGHRSTTDLRRAMDRATVIIATDPVDGQTIAELAAAHPAAIVAAITPYGLYGPYAGRPATEFTVQADGGAVALRGTADRPPFQMGGRVVEWVSGAYAALAVLAACRGGAGGTLVDVSMCEVANLTGSNFGYLFYELAGRQPIDPDVPVRTMETPSIEPAADGWVGFNTNTRDQFESFCLMIERADLLDGKWASLGYRTAHLEEWEGAVQAWTRRHPTAEIVEVASALRIPVAPVCDGQMVHDNDHIRERGVFVPAPQAGFAVPRRPYSIGGVQAGPPAPAPAVGQHSNEPFADTAGTEAGTIDPASAPAAQRGLPLAGLRVLDVTAWWAGPSATGLLAALGADVIHVESTSRIDGMRTVAGGYSRDQWWEYSPFFLQANTNKSDLTLNLDTARGRELLLRLVATADVVVENFTPRVIERFDLDWPVIHAVNPRTVMVRMPAFGLTGPWRDRPGFAQTMEQLTGLAWMTGHPDDQPRIQRGPCDPNGGLHAAIGALVALAERDRTGLGCLVEAPMVESALAVAAEVGLEWSAYGRLIGRDGNRSPAAVPQGLYRCAGVERWVAVSCASDAHWKALTAVVPGLDPTLGTADRRAGHDAIDARIEAWTSARPVAEAVDRLLAAGVPAAPLTDGRLAVDHPHLAARGFFEWVEHPVVGRHPVQVPPLRMTGIDRWTVRPAPTLGQHNEHVLIGELGLSVADVEALRSAGVIGTRPAGL